MADGKTPLISGNTSSSFQDVWKKEGGSARFVALVTVIVSLGAFLFGFHLGFSSPSKDYVKKQFGLDKAQWSTVVSVVTLGAAAGALPCGYVADRVGRKWTVILSTLPLIVGPLFFVFGKTFAIFLVSRFVTGIGVGMASVIVSMYITEISPAHLRGAFGFACQFNIGAGILFAYLLGFGLIDDHEFWKWMFVIAMAIAGLQALVMFTFPESPRWLASHGRQEEARMALARLWRVDPTGELVSGVLRDTAAEQAANATTARWLDLIGPDVRRCVMVAALLQLLQQFTGINAVIYYASSIFYDAGFKTTLRNMLATTLVAGIQVLVTGLSSLIVERAGRRSLLLCSALTMAVGLGAMGVFSLKTVHLPNALSIVIIMVYISAFSLGFGPVPWVLASEILPTHIRGKATSLALLVNWMSNYVVAQTFPLMSDSLGSAATFWFYAAWNVAAAVFVFFFVRETKGKSLEEIALLYGPASARKPINHA